MPAGKGSSACLFSWCPASRPSSRFFRDMRLTRGCEVDRGPSFGGKEWDVVDILVQGCDLSCQSRRRELRHDMTKTGRDIQVPWTLIVHDPSRQEGMRNPRQP